MSRTETTEANRQCLSCRCFQSGAAQWFYLNNAGPWCGSCWRKMVKKFNKWKPNVTG